jgi:hypothetical protein
MPARYLTKYVAEVRRQSEVATFKKLIASQSWPLSIHLTATNTIPDYEHRVRVTVIGAAITVLAHRPAKF